MSGPSLSSAHPARPALFLDRDGVINVDHAYVCRREHFDFIDGIFPLGRAARQHGYRIVVVTNQAGIGRGYYTEQDFHALTDWMCSVFAAEDAPIDRVYFCPAHPEHGIGHYRVDSPDRKPAPGMILRAERELGLDLARSILIGDKDSDIRAGIAAGVGRNVLFDPDAAASPSNRADFVVRSHREAAERLFPAAAAPAA